MNTLWQKCKGGSHSFLVNYMPNGLSKKVIKIKRKSDGAIFLLRRGIKRGRSDWWVVKENGTITGQCAFALTLRDLLSSTNCSIVR